MGRALPPIRAMPERMHFFLGKQTLTQCKSMVLVKAVLISSNDG